MNAWVGWVGGTVQCLASAVTFAQQFALACRAIVQMCKCANAKADGDADHEPPLHQEGQLLDNAPMLNKTLNDTVIFLGHFNTF